MDFSKKDKLDSLNLPKIEFTKLDDLSKRRFYELCFPVIRKKLWNCSKLTTNLGKKPVTYILLYMDIEAWDTYKGQYSLLEDNVVYSCRAEKTSFHNCKPEHLLEFRKHFEFYHYTVVFFDTKFDSNVLRTIPNLLGKKLHLSLYNPDCDFDFHFDMFKTKTTAEKMCFTMCNIFDCDSEKKLLKTKLYLDFLFIRNRGKQITDFKTLYLFVKNQQPGFKLIFLDTSYDSEELHRYFKPSKKKQKPNGIYKVKNLKLVNK
uniref:Uncharacterized protein n=1 Tax=Panagrolaimus sp. JU765 TaxID=591449 RepID=A0AC34PYN0_9BILA